MVHLIKGCPKVQIPLSKKAAIHVEVPDKDPQKLTDYLLECLYTDEQLAGITHDGKTKGTKPLDTDVSTILKGNDSYFLLVWPTFFNSKIYTVIKVLVQ